MFNDILMVLYSALALLLGVAALCIYLLWRNTEVYRLRRYITKKISDAADEDIRSGRDWKWRYETLSKVSYDKMVFSVFTPIRAGSF